MSRLALLGGGEHARVVAEAARLAGWELHGVVCDEVPAGLHRLGDNSTLEDASVAGKAWVADCRWLVAIGNTASRRRVAAAWSSRLAWATVLHPTAMISPSAGVAPGAFVGARAVLQTGARIGAHAIINTGAIIEHDCRIGDGAHIAPGAVLGGGTVVHDWALVGLGAHVRDHIVIGAGATVAMGSVVLCEVAPGRTVMGVPARERLA